MDNTSELTVLFQKMLAGDCIPQEVQVLLRHFNSHGVDSPLAQHVLEVLEQEGAVNPALRRRVEVAIARVDVAVASVARGQRAVVGGQVSPTRRLRRWLPYAAAVVLMTVVGAWLFFDGPRVNQQGEIVNMADIHPGGNRATLTLADGRTIDLNEAQAGIVVGDELVYNDGSTVLADGQQPTAGGPVDGNESRVPSVSHLMSLTTPKGGTYQITLPDGTTVWLNAASTLTYPGHFTGDERVVELEGEAYFDVSERWSAAGDPTTGAHVSRVPFKVISNSQTIEVLGTQFNVNAYADEQAIRTTLVEGSVRIWGDLIRDYVLRPGEQAVLTDNRLDVRSVDTEEFTAWKDGYFYFNDADIYTVMRQFARWYDIEVVIDMQNMDDLFIGKIPRNVDLHTALKVLKRVGVNAELNEKRQLVIKPQQ